MLGGFLRLFHWRGVPVRVHWTVIALLGFGLYQDPRAFVRVLGLTSVVVAHELGHAFLIQHYRLQVLEVRVYPFGGECIHGATRSMRQQVVIAWGGVLAQLCLFLIALGASALPAAKSVPAMRELLAIWGSSNLYIAAFNLIPVRPLDGYKAWRLKYLLPSGNKRASKGRSLVDDAVERARSDHQRKRGTE